MKETKLPELPKMIKKKEAEFGIKLRAWMEKEKRFSCAIETKYTPGNSIRFSCVEPKQLVYGMAMKSDKGVMVRIQGSNGEPDYMWCRNMPAYIGIKYPDGFVLIDVETFIMERDRSKEKSLSWQRARDIAIVCQE